MEGRQPLGTHQYEVQGDVVHGIFEGVISLADIVAFHKVLAAVLAEQKRCYVLVDSGKAVGNLGPEVRRFIAEWNRQHRVNGAAIVNDNSLVRGALSLIAAAVRLFRKDELPMRTFADESSARAWIDAQRQALLINTRNC